MRSFFKTFSAALLILLFVYAAASKLAGFDKFRHEIHNQHFPAEAAAALVYLIPGTELLAVAMLLNSRWQQAGLWLSTALMAVFTGYIGLVLAGYWAKVPCSCGGVLSGLSWRAHFVFNLCFLALALGGLRYKGKAENLRKE